MPSTLWGKFYWSDWASDPGLRVCSLASQGLWMRMLCVAAEADPTGYVTVNGRPLGVTDIARLAGVTETECESLLAELDRNGVFSRNRNSTIFSRRMVDDKKKVEIARKNGKTGGNPTLRKDNDIPPSDNPNHKGRLKTQKPRSQKPEENTRRTNSTSSNVVSISQLSVRSFVELWTEPEIAILQLEFDAIDVRALLPELLAWADGKGISGDAERKSAVYGGLKVRQAKAALGRRLTAPGEATPLAVSPELAARTRRNGQ